MRIENISAVEMIQIIANDLIESDIEKIQTQRDTFVGWCKTWIEKHPEEVAQSQKDRELKIIRERSEVFVVALVGKNAAEKWWTSRNRAFNMMTPEETWENEPTRVYKYLINQSDYFI